MPKRTKTIVFKYTNAKIDWVDSRDVCYNELISQMPDVCKPEKMHAEDPSFILYTSGSTGKPKGVMHTTGGYLLGHNVIQIYLWIFRKTFIGAQLTLVG